MDKDFGKPLNRPALPTLDIPGYKWEISEETRKEIEAIRRSMVATPEMLNRIIGSARKH